MGIGFPLDAGRRVTGGRTFFWDSQETYKETESGTWEL